MTRRMDRDFDRRRLLALGASLGASLVAAASGASAQAQTTGSDTLRAAILRLFGPATAMARGAAGDDVFAAYDERFRRIADRHWTDHGAQWETANYYDRARIYYVAWARSAEPVYLQRANALAVNYRDGYLVANKHQASAHWAQMAGVLLHWMATGDPASATAVLRVADTFSAPYYLANLGDADAEMDNRIQARVLTSLLYARQVDPSQDAVLGSKLRSALDAILRSQSADGAFRFSRSQCGGAKPFMTGALFDALIEYHDQFEADPRIAPAVAKAADYLWDKAWDPASQSFWYIERACGDEKREPAPDLNMMIVNGFGFSFLKSGEKRYRERGDQIFAGGVRRAWLQGSKVFNENYATAYRYLAYRTRR